MPKNYNLFKPATTFAVTVATTAVRIMSTKYKAAVQAFVTCDVAPVRFEFIATPTSIAGHRLDNTESITLKGWGEMSSFKAIKDGATSGKLFVTPKYPQD